MYPWPQCSWPINKLPNILILTVARNFQRDEGVFKGLYYLRDRPHLKRGNRRACVSQRYFLRRNELVNLPHNLLSPLPGKHWLVSWTTSTVPYYVYSDGTSSSICHTTFSHYCQESTGSFLGLPFRTTSTASGFRVLHSDCVLFFAPTTPINIFDTHSMLTKYG